MEENSAASPDLAQSKFQRIVGKGLGLLQQFPGLWITGLMVLSSLLVYVPAWFGDFTVVYRHLDGPLYLYIAKTFYTIPDPFPLPPLDPTYFAGFMPVLRAAW